MLLKDFPVCYVQGKGFFLRLDEVGKGGGRSVEGVAR